MDIFTGFFLLGTGGWLLLAAINNFTDPHTNRTLLYRMTSMQALQTDSELGLGLRNRAWKDTSKISTVIFIIAIYQAITALLMVFSGFLFISQGLSLSLASPSIIQTAATLSVLLFGSLWFFFLIGGLWFGYWIKMGNVQSVHFTMLIFSMLLAILINLQSINLS